MKSTKDELTERYLLLFKLDAQNLVARVRQRRKEFVEVFAMRRTREHFPWIFQSRYERATIKDLAHCSVETIQALDQFYGLVDEMKWYLYQTEDMPSTVEESVFRMTKRLEKLHDTLRLYIDAELSLDDARPEFHSAIHEAGPGENLDAEAGGLFSGEGDAPALPEDENKRD